VNFSHLREHWQGTASIDSMRVSAALASSGRKAFYDTRYWDGTIYFVRAGVIFDEPRRNPYYVAIGTPLAASQQALNIFTSAIFRPDAVETMPLVNTPGVHRTARVPCAARAYRCRRCAAPRPAPPDGGDVEGFSMNRSNLRGLRFDRFRQAE
jgi:hypothetical protein